MKIYLPIHLLWQKSHLWHFNQYFQITSVQKLLQITLLTKSSWYILSFIYSCFVPQFPSIFSSVSPDLQTGRLWLSSSAHLWSQPGARGMAVVDNDSSYFQGHRPVHLEDSLRRCLQDGQGQGVWAGPPPVHLQVPDIVNIHPTPVDSKASSGWRRHIGPKH